MNKVNVELCAWLKDVASGIDVPMVSFLSKILKTVEVAQKVSVVIAFEAVGDIRLEGDVA